MNEEHFGNGETPGDTVVAEGAGSEAPQGENAGEENQQPEGGNGTYYADFAGGFNMVHLEESNVLNVKTTMSFVEVLAEFVVNEQYPLYKDPDEEDDYYCYRKGRIFFPNLESVRLFGNCNPAISPNGTVDYGNIDHFFEEDGHYYLQGEWGELEIVSAPPILEIDELKNQPRPQKPEGQPQQ